MLFGVSDVTLQITIQAGIGQINLDVESNVKDES